jgi:hypothetical protein
MSKQPPSSGREAELQQRLAELTPEQAEMFVRALELAMKKRRIMLFGYMASLLGLLAGSVWALYIYVTHEPGTFIGWAFLVPFAVAGLIMLTFGRVAKGIKR